MTKKISIFLTILFAISFAAHAAPTNTVGSANIMGYSKVPEPASGIDIVSPQFLSSGGSSMTLSNAFTGLEDETYLYSWTGSSYVSYIYYDGYGWYDAITFDLENDTVVNQGQAFWLSGAGSNGLVSGDVPADTTITNAVSAGLNLIANPYPVALALGTITNQAGLTTLSDEDLIYAWDGSAYASYIYYDGYGWYDAVTFDLANSVEIPVGRGFWLSTAGSGGDLVFDKQY